MCRCGTYIINRRYPRSERARTQTVEIRLRKTKETFSSRQRIRKPYAGSTWRKTRANGKVIL